MPMWCSRYAGRPRPSSRRREATPAPGGPVSMPLEWEELAGAHPLDFRITNAAERLAQSGDRWRDALSGKQSLEQALERVKA